MREDTIENINCPRYCPQILMSFGEDTLEIAIS
jgi:hypothetical protein